VHGYLQRWQYDGTLANIHHALYVECRDQIGREASPTACVIDSQSVKSAEKGGAHIDANGYDAAKKIKGKKQHILVDTVGLLLNAIVHPADIQDRDVGSTFFQPCSDFIRSLKCCSPTVDTRGRSSGMHWRKPCLGSPFRL
jgi:hypothetical protein